MARATAAQILAREKEAAEAAAAAKAAEAEAAEATETVAEAAQPSPGTDEATGEQVDEQLDEVAVVPLETRRALVPVGPDGEPVFDPLLTIDDVSAWLGIPKGTLYQWRSRGAGPKSIKAGRAIRYRHSDVEAWLGDNTSQRSA